MGMETRYIGEIGLDFSVDDSEGRKKQQQVFNAILGRCAELGGLAYRRVGSVKV